MNIKFNTLTLQCRKSREIIEFSPKVSFFHGQISTGKSSIARLIHFCLGGKLERTPAITQELVSVELSCLIGDYEVLFEREAKGTNQVQVSWKSSNSEMGSVLAPIDTASGPIWGETIFNLSDLIFYFMNIIPIKVRRSKTKEDSPLVRLSFRDILWYCYLNQDDLDSSFFRLEDTYRRLKSRDVMRFLVGYYTEKLNDLEIRLDELRKEQSGKIEAVNQVRTFLKEFDYDTETEIRKQIDKLKSKLEEARSEQLQIREGYMKETHFADELRDTLRELNKNLNREEQVLSDLKERIDEQKTLKAELITTKFKLIKATNASLFLSRVKFKHCPFCGTEIEPFETAEKEACPLCKSIPGELEKQPVAHAEIVRKDLTSRLDDISESIERHSRALKRQERFVKQIKQEKTTLDERLREELKNYDSAFLSQSREIDRRVATIQERIRGLGKISEISEAIKKLEEEADMLKIEMDRIKREIKEETGTLTSAVEYVHEIERTYLDFLLKVGVPGINPEDKIVINLENWKPSILPSGDKTIAWDFYNAGSGGKKTLLNVCYALALHNVAAENRLPLPEFLIIDTPMKNIGEEVNRDIFISFYKLVYELAASTLNNTQFIIIDKEYIKSEGIESLNVYERYMTPDEDAHPPLISYYRGP